MSPGRRRAALALPALCLGVLPLLGAKGPGFPWSLFRSYETPIPLTTTPADIAGAVTSDTVDWVIGPTSDVKPERIDFTFTAGPSGVAEGGGLKVTIGHVLPTNQQVYTPFSLSVTSATFFGIDLLKDAEVTCSRPAVQLRVVEPVPGRSFRQLLRYVRYKRTERGEAAKDNLLRQIDNEFALRVEVVRGRLEPGDTVRVVLGARHGLPAPRSEASWQIVTRLDGDGDGTFGLLPDAPSFDAYSSDVQRIVLVAPSSLYPGDTSRMVIRAQDGYFLPNLARFSNATVTLDPVDGLTFPASVTMTGTPGSWDGSLAEVSVTAKTLGVYRIRGKAVVDGRTFEVLSNPIEVVPAGQDKVWFGDLHLHSMLSYDADRPPEYVYWRQRFEERHDFMALSDHDMIGTVPFAHRDGAMGLTEDEWAYDKALADRFEQPGVFAAMKAYEWTSYYFGHRNIFFAADEADPPLFHHNDPVPHAPGDEHTPGELRDALAVGEHRYIAIPHSTAWPTKSTVYTWGPGDAREDAVPSKAAKGAEVLPRRFGDPDAWPEQRELELYSTHGASEYFDNETAVDKGHPEAPTNSGLVRSILNYNIKQAPEDSGNFARDALANGWQFGFVGSSDDHYLSHIDQAYKYGLAAVFTPTLSRGSIWDALWAHHSYAVTGVRILMHFTANGRPMGSEVEGPVRFHAEIHGTNLLDRVELACWDGARWFTQHTADGAGGEPLNRLDLVADWTWEDPAPGQLCYLRVRQVDADRAWSSPVWIR